MVEQGESATSARGRKIKSSERLRLKAPVQKSRWSLVQDGAKRYRPDLAGTIVVPLVVALVAFGGGALGSWFSNKANDTSIAAERQQQVEQFRRDQRRDIYAEVLKQATRLQNVTTDSQVRIVAIVMGDQIGRLPAGPVLDRPPPSRVYDLLEPVRTDWEAAYTDFDTAISNSELSSSHAVINLAYAMRDRFRLDFYRNYDSVLGFSSRGAQDAPILRGDEGRQYEPSLLEKSVEVLREMLIAEAKADLDLNDR